jgi:hypothetical protein
VTELDAGTYHAPRQPALFVSGQSQATGALPVDGQVAIKMLASCTNLQDATGIDEEGLFGRLSAPWSVELALQAGKNGFSSYAMRGLTQSPCSFRVQC